MHEAFAGQVLSVVRMLESDAFAEARLGRDKAVGKVDMDSVAVEFRIDGDRSQPEVVGGADDPHGDLAAIGDEDFAQR